MLSLNLINHVLQQNANVCRYFSGYNGIVVSINVGSLNIVGRINAQGLLAATRKHPDTVLLFHEDVPGKILQGKVPDLSDLAIEGDMAIGMNLLMQCASLRYSPQQDVRHILGKDTADKLFAAAAKAGSTLQALGQVLMFQAATAGKQPENTQALSHQLQDLQQQLTQIEQRLTALEKCGK